MPSARFHRLTASCLIAVLAAPAALAETRRFGNTIYEVPNHFTAGRDDRGYVVLYSDKDETDVFATINVYLGGEEPNDFDVEAWARRQMQLDLEADEQTLDKDFDPQWTDVGEHRALMISRTVMDRGKRMQLYVAIELPFRYELIRFEGPMDDEEEVKASTTLLSDVFVPMLEDLQFVSEGADDLIGDPTPGPLEGVYWGGGLQSSIGLDGMMRMDFVDATYCFYPDGRFYAGVPEKGIDAFDYDELVMTHTPDVGNYAVDGDTIRLSYADGETDELEIDDGVIRDGVKVLGKARFPEDGFRFEGTRSFVFFSGMTPGVGQSGGISAWNSTTFARDGTYTHDRGSGANATFDTGAGFATHSQDKSAGTYEVAGGFVTLSPREGDDAKRWTILLIDGTDDDGKLKTSVLVNGDFVETDTDD